MVCFLFRVEKNIYVSSSPLILAVCLLFYGKIPSFIFWFTFSFVFIILSLFPRICDFFEFCTAPMSSLVAEGVVAEGRVANKTGYPVGLQLSGRPGTFCPGENTFTLKDRS